MSKKRKDFDVLSIVVFILGAAVFAMMFFPAIFVDLPNPLRDLEYTGLQIAFGHKEGNTVILDFNVLAFLMYILPLCAAIMSLIVSKGLKQVVFLVSGLIFVGSAVLIALTVKIVDLPLEGIMNYQLTVFSIIAVILSGVAALLSFFLALKK